MAKDEKQYKKSGAVYTTIRKGNYKNSTIVNAWNNSKQSGMITATVAPYHKSKIHKTKDGIEYQTMLARVFFARTKDKKVIPCLMNVKSRVIVLDDMQMCITPNGSGTTKSGKSAKGYFGTYVKK